MDGSLCKSLCNNGWLVELDPVPKMDNRVKEAWVCILISFCVLFYLIISTSLKDASLTCKQASEKSFGNFSPIKDILIDHRARSPFLDLLLKENKIIAVMLFLAQTAQEELTVFQTDHILFVEGELRALICLFLNPGPGELL